jgi:hypothetical protein
MSKLVRVSGIAITDTLKIETENPNSFMGDNQNLLVSPMTQGGEP